MLLNFESLRFQFRNLITITASALHTVYSIPHFIPTTSLLQDQHDFLHFVHNAEDRVA